MTVAAFAAYHILPYMDEGTFSSAAYNLSHRGFMGTTVLETAGTGLTRLDQHTYWVMPLYLVGQAIWMLVVTPSLFGVRLFSVAWIPVIVTALYVFMKRIGWSTAASLLSAALMALSFNVTDVAKNARPDMMCAALGWSAFAVFVSLREKSLLLAVCASNALVVLSGLTHPNGILYFAGLWLLILWFDRSRLRWSHFAAAMGPYLLGAALWSTYVLRDFPAFVDQMRANNDHRFGAVSWSTNNLSLPVQLIWGEIHDRYLVLFGVLSPIHLSWLKALALLTYVVALLIAVTTSLRKRREIQLLVSLWLLFFGIQCVFNQKLGFYFVHIEPLYAALAGGVSVLLAARSRILTFTLPVWLSLIVGIQLASEVAKARTLSAVKSENEVASFLATRARSARLIMGSACLIHAMGYDPRYLDDRYLGVRSGKHSDVIILADHLDQDLYADLRKQKPADWDAIRRRLDDYHLVSTLPGYEIYFASGFSGP
jgi:hypothetical protein